jgi:hypothetical protein
MRTRYLAAMLLVGACANDPVYEQSPTNMEAGVADAAGVISIAKSSLQIPFKTETAADKATRMALATQLGVMVPYVKVDDVAVEIEYTIKNLEGSAGQALVELNGANEYFAYDPTLIKLDPGDDEAPPTPGLSGDIPIDIGPNASYTGTFREDQILEASVDLVEISQGNVNPYAAELNINKNDQTFQPLTPQTYDMEGDPLPQSPMGSPIPRAAFAAMVRFDLVFKPTTHMVLDYDVRVRDLRGIVDDKGLDAPVAELQDFGMPPDYIPAGGGGGSGSGTGSGSD